MNWMRIARGSACLFSALAIFASSVGQVLEQNQNMVNSFLGTRTYELQTQSSGEAYTQFQPDYADTNALVQAHIELGAQVGAEGSVLLKNNGALPLAKDSGVTLLGVAADVKPYYGARVGVVVLSGQNVSLTEALKENGIRVNEEVNQAYGDLVKSKAFKKAFSNANKLEASFVGVQPGGESQYVILEPTVQDLQAQAPAFSDSISGYQDAAIVVIGRSGTEGGDYFAGAAGVDPASGARNPLALTDSERSLLSYAKAHFENVIVLINAANPLELGELEQDEGIGAILWIGFPGNYGMLGVAKLLCGEVSPSGALPDIYAANVASSPAAQNVGLYAFSNAAQYLDTAVHRGDYYLIEAEGIYTGYRYYETRYADVVMGRGNADSQVGTFDSQGGWSYGSEVVYPFGYGLSYTTFQQVLDSVEVDMENRTIRAQATVTNTGMAAGKTSVQLYGQAPYIAGGVEKSAIQLLGFEKTGDLQPGESVTLTMETELEYLSSYDNALGHEILDGGDYYFALGNGSHEALNRILADQGYTRDNGMDAAVEKGQSVKWSYAPEGGRDTGTFERSKSGGTVEARLTEADFNTWAPDTVTYLSRSDWAATWPKSYAGLSIPEEMVPLLKNDTYTIRTGDDTSAFQFGQSNGLTFGDMNGVPFDDPLWTSLLEQMTVQDMVTLVSTGNMVYQEVPSIGFLGGTLSQDAPNGFKEKVSAYSDANAPWYVSEEDLNASYNLETFGCTPLIGASFNKALVHDIGVLFGNDALFVGLCVNWGPGANLHRTPFNGRNCEYYSEDPVLTGLLASQEAAGAASKGLLTAVKHFAFNDQETNRNGVAPFMTEQKARELELRGFQIIFESGCAGTMTAFNRIGPVYVGACEGLINGILKEEWGFHGYIITDMVNPASYMTWKESIMAGTTCFDTVSIHPEWSSYITETTNALEGDAAMLAALRDACHNMLYGLAQTNLMNVSTSRTVKIPVSNWWRMTYQGITYGGAAMAAVSVAAYGFLFLKSRKERHA